MRALVVYESMYGNTRQVAKAIARGLGGPTRAVSVAAVTAEDVAFDTRAQGPALLTVRAFKGILAQLREAGFDLISEPESFKVASAPELSPGEIERARLWGESLADRVASTA